MEIFFSWNSVRWNKPLENSNGYWSRSVPFFQSISKDYDPKLAYSMPPLRRFDSQSASKNNIELKFVLVFLTFFQ